MGYLGLGSSLSMMQMVYGDDESIKFTEEVTKVLAQVGWEVGMNWQKKKEQLQ